MKRIMLTIIIGVIIMFSQPQRAEANTHAGASAQMKRGVILSRAQLTQNEHVKKVAIERVLAKHNSPLVDEAETFIIVARALKLDPFLLPSITGVESTFAQHMIDGTYNPFGFGKGTIMFDNWSDGIARVGYALRFRYINKGALTLDQIGRRYAGGSTTWAPKVQNLIGKFETEEARIRAYQNILES